MYRTFQARWLLVAVVATVLVPEAGASNDYAIDTPVTVSAVGTGNTGLSTTKFRADTPAVAIDPATRRALIVWSADDASFTRDEGSGSRQGCKEKDQKCLVEGEFEIFGAVRRLPTHGTAVAIASPFRVSIMGNEEEASAEERARFAARNPAAVWNPVAEEFLVVWEGDDDAGGLVNDEFEIFGQRIDRDGKLVGERFRISTMGSDGDSRFGAFEPAIAVNDTGSYLVVWRGDDAGAPLVDDEFEVFGQLVSPEGVLEGGRIRISAMGNDGNSAYAAFEPDVAFNPVSKHFVVVWRGDDNQGGLVDNEYEIFTQRLDVTGALAGGRVRVSNMGPDGNAAFDAFAPAIAVDPATGATLVAWHGDTRTGLLVDDEIEVFGRMMDAAGAFAGEALRISVMGKDSEVDPETRRLYRGEFPAAAWNPWESAFMVAWQGDSQAGVLVNDEYEVFGRFVDVNGVLASERIRISLQGDDDEKKPAERIKHRAERPAIAAAAGSFLALWSGGKDNYHQIRARHVASESTVLRLSADMLRRVTAPEPIEFEIKVRNGGEVVAKNVHIEVIQSEDFPISFSDCKAVPEQHICELGDIGPGKEVTVVLALATEQLQLGDPLRSDVFITAVSDTALSLPGTARVERLAFVAYREEGGSGSVDWLWLALLAVPLALRRRVAG